MNTILNPEKVISLIISTLFLTSTYTQANAVFTAILGTSSVIAAYLTREKASGSREKRYMNYLLTNFSLLIAIAGFGLLPETPLLAGMLLVVAVSANSIEKLVHFKIFQQSSNQKTLFEIRTGLLGFSAIAYFINPLITVYLVELAVAYEFFYLFRNIYQTAQP